ncbi:UNVERIFIED_CONTAM: Vacuolar-processing enzyme beta-isozyme, partial [Eudyptes robustus]
DLSATLHEIHAKNSYKELVLYVEACYSGSMFQGFLPKNTNIYAVTAANAAESSYACYC